MTLTAVDRELLDRCLARKPRSWEDFVDRFIGLVQHVVDQTCEARSLNLSREDREDVIADVFVALVQDDYAVLRRFRGESSLATYLTVVARRVAVKELLKRRSQRLASLSSANGSLDDVSDRAARRAEKRKAEREQVQRLLQTLDGIEADLVRMRYLDGMSYGEIEAASGVPANSIGPTLSRAKAKMREARSK
jgi:RNA polymerase sigma-70 factor (ECF subfamily)